MYIYITYIYTLSYNRLRQIRMISFFFFGTLPEDSKQRISFGGSSAVYGILLLSQWCSSFNQYKL